MVFVSMGNNEVVELANPISVLVLDFWDAILKELHHVYTMARMPVNVNQHSLTIRQLHISTIALADG